MLRLAKRAANTICGGRLTNQSCTTSPALAPAGIVPIACSPPMLYGARWSRPAHGRRLPAGEVHALRRRTAGLRLRDPSCVMPGPAARNDQIALLGGPLVRQRWYATSMLSPECASNGLRSGSRRASRCEWRDRPPALGATPAQCGHYGKLGELVVRRRLFDGPGDAVGRQLRPARTGRGLLRRSKVTGGGGGSMCLRDWIMVVSRVRRSWETTQPKTLARSTDLEPLIRCTPVGRYLVFPGQHSGNEQNDP